MARINSSILAFRVAVAAEEGGDIEAILAAADAPQGIMQGNPPYADLATERRIWRAIVEATGREDIGLVCGQRFPTQAMGILGYVCANAPTLHVAVEKSCQYARIMGDSMGGHIERGSRQTKVWIEQWTEWHDPLRYTVDCFVAANVACACVYNIRMNDGYTLKRGKWSMPGVPHKDWCCVGTRDLREEGSEYAICEMCETQEIRYVHTMEHEQYPDQLDCGCDCAGHMEGNSARAEKRDKAMCNRASRRQTFPDRKGWKLSKNGNPFINVDGVRCVVFQRRGKYAIGTAYAFSDDMTWGAETYDTEREAKEACFDAVEEMSARRR